MANSYILFTIVVMVVYTNCAFAMECYTTELTALQTEAIHNGKHQLQNCEDYMKAILRLRGISNAKLPANIDFHCYTLIVNKDAADVVIKGCVPAYGCGLMKNILFSRMRNHVYGRIDKIQCNECTGHGCNKPRFYEKSSLASSRLLDY